MSCIRRKVDISHGELLIQMNVYFCCRAIDPELNKRRWGIVIFHGSKTWINALLPICYRWQYWTGAVKL